MRRTRRLLLRACLAVVLVASVRVLADGSGTGSGSAEGPPSATAVPAAPAPRASAEATQEAETVGGSSPLTALAGLAALTVAPAAGADSYSRAAFGPAWTDTDRNGCDTRNDVLRRDLTDVSLKPGTHGCVVLTGTLADPYTGRTVSFVRGKDLVEVDHVVPLADAWRTGASGWPYARLLAFANDPLELLAVDASANTSKGDSDASQWLPARDDCGYAARQVAVKVTYGLHVTPAEHDALQRVLARCAGQVLPVGVQPTLATNRSPAPRSSAGTSARPSAAPPAHGFVGTGGSAGATDPDYGTCSNAKAHGAGPYYQGKDPEYDWYQDRDHDGIVCE